MQERYAGDIGDYFKLTLLDTLSSGRRIGIAWWLVSNENHNNDGKHVDYLSKPDHWREFNPLLFDYFKNALNGGNRSLGMLNKAPGLETAVTFDDHVPFSLSRRNREAERNLWLGQARTKLQHCDMIFIDPDNGLAPRTFSYGKKNSVKSILMSEIESFRSPSRTLLIYHHQTRAKGGHEKEIQYWGAEFRKKSFARISAIRFKSKSARVFFILDGNQTIHEATKNLAKTWGKECRHFDLSN